MVGVVGVFEGVYEIDVARSDEDIKVGSHVVTVENGNSSTIQRLHSTFSPKHVTFREISKACNFLGKWREYFH